MSAKAEARFPLAGQTINQKYRLIAPIGAGGMGAVYRAEQLALGRTIAVKVLNVDSNLRIADPNFERRFFLEASLSARIQHANVVTIFDYGEIEGPVGGYFIAMEYLAGVTLHAKLKAAAGPLPVTQALTIASGIARGLREAHKQGVIHRDLKPGNVILVPDEDGGERPKLVDFGLVKSLDDSTSEELTQQGTFLGSPKYMAPEQIKNIPLDGRSDLYSLGIILYQCLCGSVPFDAGQTMQILYSHVTEPLPWFRDRAPGVEIPEAVELLVRRMLEKDPANRPDGAEAFLRDLRLLNIESGGTLMPTGGLSSQTGTYAAAQLVGYTTGPSGAIPAAGDARPSMSPGPMTASGVLAQVPVVVEPSQSVAIPAAMHPPATPNTQLRTIVLVALCGLLVLIPASIYFGITQSHSRDTTLAVRAEATRVQTNQPQLNTTNESQANSTFASANSAIDATGSISVEDNHLAANVHTTATDNHNLPTIQRSQPQPPRPNVPVRGVRVEQPVGGTQTATTVTPSVNSAVPTGTASSREESGFLTFDTTPWSNVSLDGRSLGTTPLLRIRLPAGSHTLTLRNPEQNLSTTYTVTIRPTETTTRRIGIE